MFRNCNHPIVPTVTPGGLLEFPTVTTTCAAPGTAPSGTRAFTCKMPAASDRATVHVALFAM
jgi:hypothetical protein